MHMPSVTSLYLSACIVNHFFTMLTENQNDARISREGLIKTPCLLSSHETNKESLDLLGEEFQDFLFPLLFVKT